MAAALGGVGSEHEDNDEDSDGDGLGGAYGDAPFRFRTSEVAPWGEGDRPLIKVSGGEVLGSCVPAPARVLSAGVSCYWILGLVRR